MLTSSSADIAEKEIVEVIKASFIDLISFMFFIPIG